MDPPSTPEISFRGWDFSQTKEEILASSFSFIFFNLLWVLELCQCFPRTKFPFFNYWEQQSFSAIFIFFWCQQSQRFCWHQLFCNFCEWIFLHIVILGWIAKFSLWLFFLWDHTKHLSKFLGFIFIFVLNIFFNIFLIWTEGVWWLLILVLLMAVWVIIFFLKTFLEKNQRCGWGKGIYIQVIGPTVFGKGHTMIEIYFLIVAGKLSQTLDTFRLMMLIGVWKYRKEQGRQCSWFERPP